MSSTQDTVPPVSTEGSSRRSVASSADAADPAYQAAAQAGQDDQGPSRATPVRTAGDGRERRVSGASIGRFSLWAAFKVSFLLSVACGLAFVAGVALLWFMLNTMGVFEDVNQLIGDLVGAASESGEGFSLTEYLSLSTVLTGATVIAVINTVLLTLLGTALALLYNLISSLVGGLTIELFDE